ncbi:12,18-didecarboxysiroheme deacetylase [Methanohalophilus portucalensis]|uniref:12,18-didecarboxysiroheme deacetylase n=2 Tax=Methanohalophilus portucalensis TaxID=39664 RepID=A0A1L9C6C5_9EURY|nr:12,18-didecarboxysiroheme deacetylase [Methanohalophilus portucalensis]ATU09300.1 12,18-didecarboxysiroheme deacetylase [Methanohalophilus portucalensis]OJH50063.1 radical SAM protein [Methanohalophilus portucalensis FDF-1]RNI13646.1 12,18-didecarboxysiroheme deacetylase [Methanohalophilus portucalensis FDF-1]SMH31675.1 12,18-didecarboxysiroheme deacetylase [Methanohalophilus portucalensis FDF-1]
MIGISKLYCGTVEPSDALRYGRHSSRLPSHLLQFSKDKKPVVVWNITRKCNLKCIHCYAQADDKDFEGELSTEEGKRLIDDLAEFKTPVILFSGGEPLVRKDLPELAEYAVSKGLRAVISTNGTLIDMDMAKKLKEIGLSYVGISIDGTEETNDRFRGQQGAFKKALEGVHNCMKAGIKVGLRFTINKSNFREIPAIFDLLEEEGIPRICFYHLVYAGRGSDLIKQDLAHEESRETVDLIMDRTKQLYEKGIKPEVLTVDNHCDAPYLYMKLKDEEPERATEVLDLMKMNGGNSTGVGIGCVSWDGTVHPDQFWRHYNIGNIRERPFSEIWTDLSDSLLAGLKDRKPLLKEHAKRCGQCKWLDICNGNFRVRAEAVYGNVWADDPACYLTDEEIGLE